MAEPRIDSGAARQLSAALVMAMAAFAGCAAEAPSKNVPVVGRTTAVPWLPVVPQLDRHMGVKEWAGALWLSGELEIGSPSPAAGIYPYDLYLGHHGHYLYVGLEVRDVGRNPYANSTETPGDSAFVFLDEGTAIAPSARGFMFAVSNGGQRGGTNMDELRPVDGAWELQSEYEGDFEWDEEEGPISGNIARGGYGFESLQWEMVIEKSPPGEGPQRVDLDEAPAFALALGFYRQGAGTPTPDPPGDLDSIDFDIAPTPGASIDGQWRVDTWWRLTLGPEA